LQVSCPGVERRPLKKLKTDEHSPLALLKNQNIKLLAEAMPAQ
jgi:hypothetical protein